MGCEEAAFIVHDARLLLHFASCAASKGREDIIGYMAYPVLRERV